MVYVPVILSNMLNTLHGDSCDKLTALVGVGEVVYSASHKDGCDKLTALVGIGEVVYSASHKDTQSDWSQEHTGKHRFQQRLSGKHKFWW